MARQEVYHLIEPRTGAPAYGESAYATVATPTTLEADLATKLLIIEGAVGHERLADRYRVLSLSTESGRRSCVDLLSSI